MMRGELGRITECVRSGCHGFRTVSECLWPILRKARGIIECVRIIMVPFQRYWVING